MSKTISGGYQYRVNFAAAYMVRGITNSRALDNCFEMFDGDMMDYEFAIAATRALAIGAIVLMLWGD